MERSMSDRPNILLVAFDSLSAHDLWRRLDDLPTLRDLLNKGRNFTNAYTCCPESSPSRASLFTGLDIAAHRLWTDGVVLPKRETTLPEVFAAHGYRTWLVGRRQLAGVSNWTTEHARRLEYHHFDWAHGSLHRSRQNAYLTWLQNEAPDKYAKIFPRQSNPDNAVVSPEQRKEMMALPDALSFNGWVAQQTCKKTGEAPFFGVVGFVVGQTMGSSAAPIEALDPTSLKQADAALATICKTLPENTVLVVTAGRGSVDEPTSTDMLQEAAIKVPLLIYAANGAHETIQAIVSTMDIAPTLYEMANIYPPQRIQGTSLMSNTPRGWALSRLRHPSMQDQTAFRSKNWKLIVTHEASDTGLYNLNTDPEEADNLANSPDSQERLEAMFDLMIDARVALEDRLEPRIAKF